jgi:hypothetical protein
MFLVVGYLSLLIIAGVEADTVHLGINALVTCQGVEVQSGCIYAAFFT